ncbi:MAG: class I SAM-dependent methyltransferase [Chloroflexota bacterium]
MRLIELVQRRPRPEAWAEGEKIPWNEAEFSQRMLAEHLSQEHDAASRRSEKIEQHVAWIYAELLGGKPGRVLDLGCGPGLYASRLGRLGCTCKGIDFSPASIAYARRTAEQEGLNCTYLEEDVRRVDYGSGYDLAMMIFGEFNVFRMEDASLILRKAQAALRPGGMLLLEAHTFQIVQALGEQGTSWYSSAGGLFCEQPYLCLMENFWDAERRVTTERYFIVEAASGEVQRYASSMQAYSEEEYRTLAEAAGFREVRFQAAFGEAEVDPNLVVITARR